MRIQILLAKGQFCGDHFGIFFRTRPSTVRSDSDVGNVPHAVDLRSAWPAAEAVEIHTKFSYDTTRWTLRAPKADE